MIVVTTPTGNIGSQLVNDLLAAGEAVRVVARDPSKLAPARQGKIEVVQGSMEDESVMNHALTGAESLFFLVPPSFTTTDDVAYYLGFTRPALNAMKQQGVKRIVGVSGIGRGPDLKAGPVTASHLKDVEIESTGVDFRALWCPGFFENMLRQLGPLKNQGAFYLPGKPDYKIPNVATRDIASRAARLLIDRSWTGQGGIGVLGPEDLSPDDMAATMTEVLGTPIRFQPVPFDAYKKQLLQRGASEHFAQGLIEMLEAKGNGLDHTVPRNAENNSPTSFRQWCEEVLKPAFLQA